MTKSTLLITASAVILATATAYGPAMAESFPPIKNSTVKTECGECHMAFFAEMLPRQSWLNILNDLSNHFGEDASIAPDPLKEIIAFHTSRASDVSKTRGARKWRKGLKKGQVPERITTAPRFIRKHKDKDFKWMWKKYKVTSKADCVACHKMANKGLFDDD